MKTGFITSGNLPTDVVYGGWNVKIPEEYELKIKQIVVDQGNVGSCVSCAIWEMLGYYVVANCKIKSMKSPAELYYERKDKSVDGMSPREAFEILKTKDVIKSFAKVNSLLTLKQSILMNCASLIALPYKSDKNDFWRGNEALGGHAVAAIGWDSNGIIIKNSWGYDYGINGIWNLPYEDFNKVIEAWTILS